MNQKADASHRVERLLGLGPLESEIMRFAWSRGQATVADVVAAIGEQRRVAYTTVMTVMARLAAKGLLRRTLSGKAYTYEPAKTLDEYRSDLAKERIRGLLRDFGDLAVAGFVAEMEAADPDRLRRLSEFLEQRGSQ